MRRLEIRRHTDNDGDSLTEEGVSAALEIGARLEGPYEVVVSTGAQRATQTAACFLAAGCGGLPRRGERVSAVGGAPDETRGGAVPRAGGGGRPPPRAPPAPPRRARAAPRSRLP
jgi:hypothetical protein